MRLETGGLIDRTHPVRFSFGGDVLTGFQGDTLASALLANDVRLIGRSFKYHRPRGVMTRAPKSRTRWSKCSPATGSFRTSAPRCRNSMTG
jgi:hypothetical protein